jgi:Fe-S-cluster containining protein
MKFAALPVLDDCRGCGACCMTQGSPPGYAYPPFRPDDLPAELVAELDAYYAECERTGDWRDEQPCFWLDLETRRCKHYRYRPDICQDFEVGSEACLEWRAQPELMPRGGKP